MDYIDRKTFKEHIVESYKLKYVTETLGKDLLLIANHLLNKRNYINYDINLKEDMVGFAVSKFIKYFKNFNPDKCKNPFNYVTRIFETSFLDEYHRFNKFYDKRNKLKLLYMEKYTEKFPNRKFESNCEIITEIDNLYQTGINEYES